jgi:ligand-binding sensor domain-containing protein
MQRIKTKSLRLVFLLSLLSVLLLKADNGFLIPGDQLPSSLINCITQDRYGLIWVGTDYGLSRYDGYHFTNYFHDSKDTTSINSNTITAFLVDRQGQLWIGSALGLMRYDYSCNKFIRFRFPGVQAHPRVYSLIENRYGDILIGTAGYGLFKVSHGQNTMRQVKGFVQRNYDDFFTNIYSDNKRLSLEREPS